MVNGVATNFGSELLDIYNAFILSLPSWAQEFIGLFLLVVVVVIYGVFVWKFYTFVSKKNPLGLNLHLENQKEDNFFKKAFNGILYFVEYILILPFFIFIAFVIFTLFLVLLIQEQNISHILIVSATIIGAIRVTAYIPRNGEKISRELAKMLPLTLLGLAMIQPGFFNIESIIGNLKQMPSFLSNISIYLGFIVTFEIILRFFDSLFSLFGVEEIEPPY